VIVGIGIIVGSKITTGMAAWASETPVEGGPAAINFTKLFSVPTWASVACLVILLIFCPNRRAATAKGLQHQPDAAAAA
jgi:hypothetical protein